MWAYIAAMIAGLGLPYAHRFWAARRSEWHSEIFTAAIIYSAVVGILTIGAGEIIVPHLVGDRTAEVMWILRLFLLIIPVIIFSEMLHGLLEGSRSFAWLGAARMTFISLQAIGYLFFWAIGHLTLPVAVIVIVAAKFCSLTMMIIAVRKQLRVRWSWNWNVLRAELDYSLRSYPGILTEFTVLRLDQMLLVGMASSAVIGLYAVAVALSEITATLASSVADVMLPEVAASNDRDKSLLLLAGSLRLTIYAHLLALIPLWFAAPYILKFIYGAEFAAATSTLRVLFVASIILSAGMITLSGLNGFGHPGLSTISRLASAVTTIALLLLLLPVYGMMGAAIASCAGYAVMLAAALFWLKRRRGVKLWQLLRPRSTDISKAKLRSIFKWEFAQPHKAEV